MGRRSDSGGGDSRTAKRRGPLALAALAGVAELAAVRGRGYGFGGNVIVRCREGHLFSTIWIPGASVKSLRLGFWRLQRCPVGSHWSLVTPVREDELSEEQLRAARAQRDVRIP